MDPAQNLKKIFKNLVKKTLQEIFFHFTEQREKQILKRHDNSLSTMFSQNPLTTESQPGIIATSSLGISEKIIMETQIEPIVQVRNWAIERIRTAEDYDTALAIAGEFEEWLDLEGQDEISYLCLEEDVR
jgi:hypothetical protein